MCLYGVAAVIRPGQSCSVPGPYTMYAYAPNSPLVCEAVTLLLLHKRARICMHGSQLP
jgi:hypothetical protein